MLREWLSRKVCVWFKIKLIQYDIKYSIIMIHHVSSGKVRNKLHPSFLSFCQPCLDLTAWRSFEAHPINPNPPSVSFPLLQGSSTSNYWWRKTNTRRIPRATWSQQNMPQSAVGIECMACAMCEPTTECSHIAKKYMAVDNLQIWICEQHVEHSY